ncbi:hypothetical protein ACFIVR_06280 [Oenococcus oeni]|uniref:hypothetical protein n=1 Tax=Oenococcus oeni TaxID=1247 RepID=UPI000A484C94|nr:hypothetical protein [Oenococcus oeni]
MDKNINLDRAIELAIALMNLNSNFQQKYDSIELTRESDIMELVRMFKKRLGQHVLKKYFKSKISLTS